MNNEEPELMERYTANERTHHWLTAIAFVLAALSGLVMFHPALFWLSALFGGGQWTRILHPFIGVAIFILFLTLAVRFWRPNLLDADDVRWLRQIGDVLERREDVLPEVGRYNAGQKVFFFVAVISIVLLLLSGIVIWRRYFSGMFTVDVIRIAALVHAVAAFVMIIGIIVHIYAAIWVKGSLGAMVRGTVTLGWARKHHVKWFRHSVK